MVREMMARGVEADVIALAVETAEVVLSAASADVRGQAPTVDAAGERRRTWDRERKREQRSLRLSESEWLPLVAQILNRDGHKCTYCGSTEKLTADHVVPMTRGGTHDPSNLTACCIPCNSKKSNRLVSEWLPASSTVFHPSVHPIPQTGLNGHISTKEDSKKEEKKDRPAKPLSADKRGHRLPEDWQPTPQDWATACVMLGDEGVAREQLETFRDHWKAAPDKDAKKDDWDATWRNWVRRQKSWGNRNANRTAGARTPGQSAFLAAATRRARTLLGDNPMAGPVDPIQPAAGPRTDNGRATGFAGPLRGAGDRSSGFEFDAGRTIEGESRAGDEASGWISHGSDVGLGGRRTA